MVLEKLVQTALIMLVYMITTTDNRYNFLLLMLVQKGRQLEMLLVV